MTLSAAFRWVVGGGERGLYVDHRRINAEVQAERRAEAADSDVAYRNKVKRRMLLGLTAAELPPLYRREERRQGIVTAFPENRTLSR